MKRFLPETARGPAVCLAGLATASSVFFLVVALANRSEWNVMGWFVVVFPIGALAAGFAAGSGFGLGAWFAGFKVNKSFIWAIFVGAIACWFGAHYLTYINLIRSLDVEDSWFSFAFYLSLISENIAFESSRGDEDVWEPGKLGYFFTVLEAAGFSLGAIIPVLILGSKSFCAGCSRYFDDVDTGVIASSLKKSVLGRSRQEERSQLLNVGIREVTSKAKVIVEAIKSLGYKDSRDLLSGLPASDNQEPEALAWVTFKLARCPGCGQYGVTAVLSGRELSGRRKNETLITFAMSDAEFVSTGSRS